MSTSPQPDSATIPMRPVTAQASSVEQAAGPIPAAGFSGEPHSTEEAPGSIPVEIKQKSVGEMELGSCVAVFHGRPFTGWDLLRIFLPGILAIALPLYYGVSQANDAYMRFGIVSADFRSRPWFLLSALGLLTFSLLLILRWRAALQFVSLHRNGLRYRLGSLRTRSLRWSELAGISVNTSRDYFFNLPMQTHMHARLLPVNGGAIRLGEPLQDIPELISRIKAFLYPRLLPRMLERLTEGNWLAFGPVAIQLRQIRLKKREYPWTAVRSISVQDGKLLVSLKDQKTWQAPVSAIPNLEILLQIIQQQIKT